MKERVIEDEFASGRLDKYLSDWLELSRSETLGLLEGGYVRLNNRKITIKQKGHSLQSGDVLTVSEFRPAGAKRIFPNDGLELKLITDQPNYVVVNKAAGMNIIPKSESEKDTVLNALLARYPQIQGVGEGGLRSGIVHRLDKDTSGVLIVVKTQERWQSLREAFAKHKSQKIYHAIVEGKPRKTGKAEMNLIVARHKPAKVRVLPYGSRQSRLCDLSWRVLEEYKKHSLLEIRLGSGFLHQIRVMMAELGYPLLADELYGSPSHIASRQMLHAFSIQIDDILAQASYPTDFHNAITQLV